MQVSVLMNQMGKLGHLIKNWSNSNICEIKSFVSIHIINETFTINEKASLVKVTSQSQKHKSHFDVNNTGKKMFGYMEKGRRPKSQLAFLEVKPYRSFIVIYQHLTLWFFPFLSNRSLNSYCNNQITFYNFEFYNKITLFNKRVIHIVLVLAQSKILS